MDSHSVHYSSYLLYYYSLFHAKSSSIYWHKKLKYFCSNTHQHKHTYKTQIMSCYDLIESLKSFASQNGPSTDVHYLLIHENTFQSQHKSYMYHDNKVYKVNDYHSCLFKMDQLMIPKYKMTNCVLDMQPICGMVETLQIIEGTLKYEKT